MVDEHVLGEQVDEAGLGGAQAPVVLLAVALAEGLGVEVADGSRARALMYMQKPTPVGTGTARPRLTCAARRSRSGRAISSGMVLLALKRG
ncbi:hypothetical protein SR39_31840 [Methylobacterium radiotolerans]|nr:hypothetical protein SR39_31840 [Methylobacterium radiotolerans]